MPHYKPHDLEAEKAISILENKENRDLIFEVTLQLCNKIQAIGIDAKQPILNFTAFYNTSRKLSQNPTHKDMLFNGSTSQCISLLKSKIESKNQDGMIAILTVIWILPKYILKVTNPKKAEEISDVYRSFDTVGRNHKTVNMDATEKLTLRNNQCIGESNITSTLLSNLDNLYKLSAHYIEHDTNTKTRKSMYSKNKTMQKPYLAGTSGMINCFSMIFELLNINLDKEKQKHLIDIMSSFVVSIGFHTFQECYDAFELGSQYDSMMAIIIAMQDHFAV